METIRVFIAIKIDMNQTIIRFVNDVRKSDAGVKLVESENMHITLKFLGDTKVESIEKIKAIIKRSCLELKPFIMKFRGVGVFPNQHYLKVVWIGIHDAQQLIPFIKTIDDRLHQLGFKREKRDFSPHLTIGRVRTAKNKQKLLQIIQEYQETIFGEQHIETIQLMKSDLTPKGPIYTTLEKFPL